MQHASDEAARRFELALRRLNMSVERAGAEDRLIDYWIALETLFVSDARGEIRYRARTRISKYIGSSLAERRQIADSLGTSYTRRSEVVHGDRAKPDLGELTDTTGEILRQSLKTILVDGVAPDVEALDLG